MLKAKLLMISLLLVSLSFPHLVQAFAYYHSDVIIYQNYFSQQIDGWQSQNSHWQLEDGYLTVHDSDPDQTGAIIYPALWKNFILQFDVNNLQGSTEDLYFRYQDKDNYYKVTLIHNNSDHVGQELSLSQIKDGVTTLLQRSYSVGFHNNHWSHITIDVSGQHIQVWNSGDFLFQYDNSDDSLDVGGIGFAYQTAPFEYEYFLQIDNLQVSSLDNLTPVVFIPGIGGSELIATQELKTNNFLYHQYDKVWINLLQAAQLGEDHYFDVLAYDSLAQPLFPEIQISGALTDQGYQDVDQIFLPLGYIKDYNYFVFTYDWRDNLTVTAQKLEQKINQVLEQTQHSQVDIVAHSMGGLLARRYIADNHQDKVNKLIEVGVPHLGSPQMFYQLMYGLTLGKSFLNFFNIGIDSLSVKKLLTNFPSAYVLLPSEEYLKVQSVYSDDGQWFNSQQLQSLYSQSLLNTSLVNSAREFHLRVDSALQEASAIKIYQIVGVNMPTIGQVIDDKDHISYVNGDGTVPLISAAASKTNQTYYFPENHQQLMKANSQSVKTIQSILQGKEVAPVVIELVNFPEALVLSSPEPQVSTSPSHSTPPSISNNEQSNSLPSLSVNSTSSNLPLIVPTTKTVPLILKASPSFQSNQNLNLSLRQNSSFVQVLQITVQLFMSVIKDYLRSTYQYARATIIL